MWVYRHSAFTVAFMCLWCLYLWYISYILMRRMYWKSKDKGVCMHANMVLEGWMLVDVHLEHGQKSLCRGGAWVRLCVHRCLQAVMHGGHTEGLYMPRQGWYFFPVSAVSSIMVITGRLWQCITLHPVMTGKVKKNLQMPDLCPWGTWELSPLNKKKQAPGHRWLKTKWSQYKLECDCVLLLLRQELRGHQIKVAGGRFKANNQRQICTECGVALGNPVPQDAAAAWYLHSYRLEKKERQKKKNTP